MRDITLFDYFAIIRKRWLLVLLIPILAVALSSIYFFKDNQPVYEAKSTIAVGKRAGDQEGQQFFYGQMANRELTDTYMNIARTGVVAERAAALAPQKVSAGYVRSGLEVSKVPGTQLLAVKFRDGEPTRAAELSNAAAEAIIERLAEIEQGDVATLVDPALVPTSPIPSTGKLAKVLLSGILGFLISVLLAFLLEFAKNPELKKLR